MWSRYGARLLPARARLLPETAKDCYTIIRKIYDSRGGELRWIKERGKECNTTLDVQLHMSSNPWKDILPYGSGGIK